VPEPVKSRAYDATRRLAASRDRRARILDAARAEFLERGYPRTTMTAIAARAGVAADTVYELIGRKPAVFRLLVETAISGADEPVDARRFRMTFGIDGLAAHEEDSWIGREVRVGDALLRVEGNVGRCAATTRQPETGVVDFKTLHHLRAYRGEVPTTEPLPFGVHARVLEPGRVRLGDPVGV
jgi:AcrR family transcriptional regulator